MINRHPIQKFKKGNIEHGRIRQLRHRVAASAVEQHSDILSFSIP